MHGHTEDDETKPSCPTDPQKLDMIFDQHRPKGAEWTWILLSSLGANKDGTGNVQEEAFL